MKQDLHAPFLSLRLRRLRSLVGLRRLRALVSLRVGALVGVLVGSSDGPHPGRSASASCARCACRLVTHVKGFPPAFDLLPVYGMQMSGSTDLPLFLLVLKLVQQSAPAAFPALQLPGSSMVRPSNSVNGSQPGRWATASLALTACRGVTHVNLSCPVYGMQMEGVEECRCFSWS